MTNLQFYIALALPTFTIILGFLVQHSQIAAISQRLGVMENDLRQFYRDLGKHDKAIEILEKQGGR